jgi:hypothetical protein
VLGGNADGRQPPARGLLVAADAVAETLERRLAQIADSGFFAVERVLARSGDEHKEVGVAEILDAGAALFFAAGARPLGEVESVTLDEFGVEGGGVFVVWEDAADIEVVAVREEIDRDLLDKSLNGRGNVAIHKTPPPKLAARAAGAVFLYSSSAAFFP